MRSSQRVEPALEDRHLPGLPALLDPDSFIHVLRALMPTAAVGDARITYLRYKPGTNCLASFQATSDGRPIHGYAKAFPLGDREKLWKGGRSPHADSHAPLGHLVHDELALGVWLFPADRKLTSLSRLLQPGAWPRLPRSLVPGQPDPRDGALQQLHYKPERRYVARLLVSGEPRAVLKLYTGHAYDASKGNTSALRSHGCLRLARQLGHSQRYHALAFEWLPGTPLSDVITSPAFSPDQLERVGRALAALHAQPARRLSYRSRATEVADLAAIAAGLAALSPIGADLGRQATELTDRLGDRLRRLAPAIRPCHGDFDAGHVVLADGTVGVIDLDRAHSGDPASDIGFFLAHLERHELYGRLTRSAVDARRGSFLDGYAAVERLPAMSRIDLYAAVGLVRLAPEPFRYLEAAWDERIRSILGRAAELLDVSEAERA